MIEFIKQFKKLGEYVLAAGIVCILLVLLLPIPTPLLDCLLALSVGLAFVILMATLFIGRPLELSVFPTILLVTTMLRLALNIASTRLILSRGHVGIDAAGDVIAAFGGFIMQGNVVIGLIVFLILTLINFVVITKGSGRIAEVAARFSLDAMPGKQMAIDADLAAGIISENDAKHRRKTLEDESTFFGAMDGANKFVRGDAIAGLIITFINLVGGMVVGILQKGLSFDTAVQTYTILTIGDGLISQVPSLIISLSSGLLVTKAGISGATDKVIFSQIAKYPQALGATSLITILMATLPGVPFSPFFLIALISGIMAFMLYAAKNGTNLTIGGMPLFGDPIPEEINSNQNNYIEGSSEAASNEVKAKDMAEVLQLDLVRLEIGFGLMELVGSNKGHNLSEQIKALRDQIAQEYGFVLPTVRIRDSIDIDDEYYVVKIKEIEAGRGFVRPDKFMVMDPTGRPITIKGESVKEPTFGLNAKWINEENKEEALFNNYTVVDPSTVITTHLTELVKENITDLLSYSETQKLINELGSDHKQLIKDVIPDVISIATLQKVLQNLLSEMISIRDLPIIIESVADASRSSKNLTDMTEYVRSRLARQICHQNSNKDGFIPIVALSPEWEQVFVNSLRDDKAGGKQLSMPPSKVQEFIDKIRTTYENQASKGYVPVLLTSSMIRPYVRSVVQRFRPNTVVLSQNEIHYKAKIRTIANI